MRWQPQSEDGLVQQAKLANDSSFYSFKLNAGPQNKKNKKNNDAQSEYNGLIHR